jgi:hypothetical protein
LRFRFSGPPTGDASAAQDLESGSALAGGAQDGADGADAEDSDDDTEKPVSSEILSVCFLYFSIALFTAPSRTCFE